MQEHKKLMECINSLSTEVGANREAHEGLKDRVNGRRGSETEVGGGVAGVVLLGWKE